MDTGILIVLINIAIPVIIILFVFLFIKRYFAKNKKFADELKLKIAEPLFLKSSVTERRTTSKRIKE